MKPLPLVVDTLASPWSLKPNLFIILLVSVFPNSTAKDEHLLSNFPVIVLSFHMSLVLALKEPLRTNAALMMPPSQNISTTASPL